MVFYDVGSGWKWGQKTELAKRAGISRQYLSDILNCRKRALPELAVKLEAASRAMGILLKKDNFMFPKEAPKDLFNTPESRKKKMEHIKPMSYDCQQMIAGLASGNERRSSKRKISKHDKKLMNEIVERASTHPLMVKVVEGRILRRMEIMVNEQNQKKDAAGRTGESSGAASGAPETRSADTGGDRIVYRF